MAEIQAKTLAESACWWVKQDRERFRKMKSLVRLEMNRGNPRVQEGDIILLAKQCGLDWATDDDFRRDHNIWAVLTRYMVMTDYKLARVLHFRKSKVDDIDLARVWHENVDCNTFFQASSWREAKEMCESEDGGAA